jgi:hypothetical protein
VLQNALPCMHPNAKGTYGKEKKHGPKHTMTTQSGVR